MLTDRDIAAAVWLTVVVAWAASKPSVRKSFVAVFRSLGQWTLLFVFAHFGIWMATVIAVAAVVQLWNATMLKDTLFALAPAFGIVFASASSSSKRGFLARSALGAVGLLVFIEVYLNSATFDLVWELLLQPVLFVLVGISVLAPRMESAANVKRLADGLLGVIAILLFIPPTLIVLSGSVDVAQTFRDFALPVWIVLGALPFAFAFTVFASYETVYVRLKWMSPDKRVPRHVLLALMRVYKLDYRSLAADVPKLSWHLVRTHSLDEAMAMLVSDRDSGPDHSGSTKESRTV